jgi:hypothetical protein
MNQLSVAFEILQLFENKSLRLAYWVKTLYFIGLDFLGARCCHPLELSYELHYWLRYGLLLNYTMRTEDAETPEPCDKSANPTRRSSERAG